MPMDRGLPVFAAASNVTRSPSIGPNPPESCVRLLDSKATT